MYSTSGRKGGELASAVHAYTKTGDPYMRSLVQHILSLVSHPVLSFLYRWIYDGELEDTYHEVRNATRFSDLGLRNMDTQLLFLFLFLWVLLTIVPPHFIWMPCIFCTLLWKPVISLISRSVLRKIVIPILIVGNSAWSNHLFIFTNNSKLNAKLGLGLLSHSPVFLAETVLHVLLLGMITI